MQPHAPVRILVFLLAINFLNFMDRGIIPGSPNQFNEFIELTSEDSDEETHQSRQLGMLQSGFILGYSIAAVICGRMVHYCSPFRLMVRCENVAARCERM
jgi:hypothetical protein